MSTNVSILPPSFAPIHVQGGAARDASLPSWMPGATLSGYLDGTLPGVSFLSRSRLIIEHIYAWVLGASLSSLGWY